MAKNIVICSDGTGNRGGKTRGTDVWRIFNAVDRHNRSIKQITYYDDGVGTQNCRSLRLLAGAFGWGLSRNIREAYAFLAMNYECGDRIYLFGFSRGAYTVRSLAGVIHRCELIPRDALIKAGRRRKRVLKWIVKAYRSTDDKKKDQFLCKVRHVLSESNLCYHESPTPIHFIGVWDTVAAVGMPFKGLTRLLDKFWGCVFRRRLWVFHDRKLGCHVHYACQALALDDERRTFHPLIWKHANNWSETDASAERSEKCKADGPEKQVVDQVWFAGVHANVGGGYPKDAMALVSLDWMMGKAAMCSLRFKNGVREDYQRDADVHGRLYDSRAGLRAIYRYGSRNPYEDYCREKKEEFLPTIHGSVFERIERGTDFYAPKVIRENEYKKVWTDSGPYAEPQSGGGTDDASQ